MASGKWERVGKGGKPANKPTGQQKSHKNTKDSDKPLDGSQLIGMIIPIVSCSRLLLMYKHCVSSWCIMDTIGPAKGVIITDVLFKR